MANISARKNRQGTVTGYRLRVCVGRDERYKQIWRTRTIPRPEGLTPAREAKEVQRIADEWEQAKKAEYERTRSKTSRDRITLADFIQNHWWPDYVLDGTHKPTTIAYCRRLAEQIIEYFGEKKRLQQIDVEDLKRFIIYFRTEAKTERGKPYSASTVHSLFGELRTILEYARRTHYLLFNPVQDLSQKEKPHLEKRKVDFLEPEKAREFLRCLDDEPLFWKVYFNILITCGLRRGEAVGLQWRDIDAEKMTLNVCRNVTIDRDAPEKYRVGDTKTGESRTVPLSTRVYGLLMELKREREAQLKGKIWPNTFIFCRGLEAGTPIYPSTPTKWQAEFVKRHGLPNVSPHDLRHSAATLALMSGASLKDVQALLGHADPATTLQFYVGVTEEAQRRTVEGIEKLLG